MTATEQAKAWIDEIEVYGYNIRRIATETGYKEDSLRKALRTEVKEKMYNKIKALHDMAKEKAANPISEMYQEIKYIKATNEVLFTMLSDLLAKQTNRSGAIIKSEYEKLRDEKLKE